MKRLTFLLVLAAFGPVAFGQEFKLKPVHIIPPPKQTTEKKVAPLAPNLYYNQCFGFFCKQEWKVQQRTGLPVKIRLGDYSTTQRIEYKHY
ncbi:hypothetical protein [Chitinophaga sp. sic0106]|uniref:hypothetical protein n=1 Tax=Chitinophaga sp. sic0106 TaxID=2854785 RepID=UPI001C43A047|nr:hypothetical protein [Chitinophaga sp. sic0106]MBV7528670.1 hypothetical protein [Chitinophaga sp. sic0106]